MWQRTERMWACPEPRLDLELNLYRHFLSVRYALLGTVSKATLWGWTFCRRRQHACGFFQGLQIDAIWAELQPCSKLTTHTPQAIFYEKHFGNWGGWRIGRVNSERRIGSHISFSGRLEMTLTWTCDAVRSQSDGTRWNCMKSDIGG